MSKNKDQPVVTLEDTMLVAFLRLRGLTLVPWVCTDQDSVNNGRVVFDVVDEKEKTEEAMKAYFGNETVKVQDYVRCLKETKSEMYNMKKVIAKN